MLNQIVVVGRQEKEIKIEETEEGNKRVYLELKVPRSYKNDKGEYENDFIECVIWNGIATQVAENCKSGDLLGIKGRMQKGLNDDKMIIVAEKVTYLSSNKKESENE